MKQETMKVRVVGRQVIQYGAPDGTCDTYRPGDVFELGVEEAARLIKAGKLEPVE
jgi:hypothetical protein